MATSEQQTVKQMSVPSVRVRIAGFVTTIQVILLAVHWFVYQTWAFFQPETDSAGLRVAVAILSVSFVGASLLAFRYWNLWVRAFYRIAAVWLGFLNFFFVAACASWVVYPATLLAGLRVGRGDIATATFGLAALAGIYGLVNAHWPRVKRIRVKLPNLPEEWRGRVAAVVSDVHLGHVNGTGFVRRIVGKLQKLRPDVIFLPGDLFDGTKVDLEKVAAPWKELSPRFGMYFVTGNHEEFSDRTKYLQAVSGSGIRVLNNEKITVNGLQVVGVHDSDAADAEEFRSVLESAGVDRERASILLSHVPRGLGIAEKAGISLQVSGHTHGGQIFPFTWFTRRIFREYTYGLHQFGKLQIYTTCGTGTWGPPMRVGTRPEIVMLEFE